MMPVRPARGCVRCGNCCRVSGYVYLQDGEVQRIADCLALSIEEFTSRFTRLTADRKRLSLTEKDDGSCIFLEKDACRIQAAKPRQCRTFPEQWRFEGWRDICRGSF